MQPVPKRPRITATAMAPTLARLVEWLERSRKGLEQGFTLPRPATVTPRSWVPRVRFGPALSALLTLAFAPVVAFATYPGVNGLIAYSDVVDEGSPVERRAVFIHKQGQFTHPLARGSSMSDSDSGPAWSPDGKQLAFVRRDGVLGEYGIFVVQEDATGLRRVLDTGQLVNGQPGLLKGKPITSLTWTSNGQDIRFVSNGNDWIVRGADDGVDLPLGGGDVNLVPFPPANDIDAGAFGVLGRCGNWICIYDGIGGYGIVDIELPGVDPNELGGLTNFRWWPKSNQRKIAFVALVRTNEIWFNEIFAVEFSTSRQTRRVTQLTSSGVVACSNTDSNGVTTTTTVTQYSYRNPVPSPDARYLLAHRTENVPTIDAEGKCSFAQKVGLFQLRETGALQSTLVEGSKIDDGAWQASPGKVVIQVSDGHDHPLDDLKVELRDFDDDERIIAVATRNVEGGTYIFDDVPAGRHVVRATLIESKATPAFEIRHGQDAAKAVWVERFIDLPPDVIQSEFDFPLSDSGGIYATSLGSAEDAELWHRLDDLAAIYYETHRFVKWARANLVQDAGPTVVFYAFATATPYDAILDPFSSYYAAPDLAIWMGVNDSAYDERDGIPHRQGRDGGPMNTEWHEYSHHLLAQFVHPGEYCGTEPNHGGYSNVSSCDSLQEGLAVFLATQIEANPDYVGMGDLESHLKAWGLRFAGLEYGDAGEFIGLGLVSLEELAVAALLWDIVDGGADAEYTQGIAWNQFHMPVVYRDDVSLSLSDLWQILTTSQPKTVFDLQRALRSLPRFADLDVDLDSDGIDDVNSVDQLFLMHGFFRIDLDQIINPGHRTYHYDVALARRNGLPPTEDIGKSNHYAFDYAGVVSRSFVPRFSLEIAPEAHFEVQVLDASGTPLYGAELELSIAYPDSEQTLHRQLGAGDDAAVHLELPMHFDYLLPTDAPLPACDPANDFVVDVIVHGSINGYLSADAPSFDNCTYLHAILDAAGGGTPLSLTFNFPEDSVPAVTTADPRTVGTEILRGPEVGDYAVWGYWTVELSCGDPADGGFASGCRRIEYSLDGGPFVAYAKEITLEEPGLYTVDYRSIDAAGNEEGIQSLKLGVLSAYTATKPVTTLTTVASIPPVSGYMTGFWTVTMSCLAANAGQTAGAGCWRTEYSINNGSFVPYTGDIILSEPGVYGIRYRSVDVLGNTEALRSITLIVAGPDDTKAPFTAINVDSSGPQSILHPQQTMGFWTIGLQYCADAFPPYDQVTSGCSHSEYSLDGGPIQLFEGEVVISDPGQHTFAYRSIDFAGNVETFQITTVEVMPPSDVDGDGSLDFEDNCHTLANSGQEDTDGDGFGNRCDPDFNNNGTVDSNDASLLKARLGTSGAEAPDQDLDGNGLVNVVDMNILKALFRKPPGPSMGYTYSEIYQ